MTESPVFDGNAVAGELSQVFSFESTTAVATCAGCGARAPMATWVAYLAAPGIVSRCASCDRVQIRIVHSGDGRTWVDLSGVVQIEIIG